MIYIHTFKLGIDGNRKEHRRIHDTYESAKKQQTVLGGVIQAFESIENIVINERMKEIIVDEVSCIIDDFSTCAPGSARMMKPGSEAWDSYKIKTLNNIRKMLNGNF